MKIYKIVVQRVHKRDDEAQLDAFSSLLGAYRLDGHVLGRELMTVSLDRHLEAYVFVPANDAFASEAKNEWIAKRTNGIVEVGLSEPEFIQVGDDISEFDGCSCSVSSSFILFTTCIQIQSPMRCGNCFRPVPLYRLPRFKNNEFSEVISWADDWKACDSLFMNSTTGERFGYREMSQVDSSLSRHGQTICKHFEQSTGKPTYYYLHRYYGRSKALEEARPCPRCGGEWRLADRWHHLFDFRCEKCQLVSSLSSAVI